MAGYKITIKYTAPAAGPELRPADIMAVWANEGAWPDKVTDDALKASEVVYYKTNKYDNGKFPVIDTPSVDPVDSLTSKFAIFNQAMKAGSVEFEVADYESTVYFTQIGAKLPGFEVNAAPAAAAEAAVEANTANAGGEAKE